MRHFWSVSLVPWFLVAGCLAERRPASGLYEGSVTQESQADMGGVWSKLSIAPLGTVAPFACPSGDHSIWTLVKPTTEITRIPYGEERFRLQLDVCEAADTGHIGLARVV